MGAKTVSWPDNLDDERQMALEDHEDGMHVAEGDAVQDPGMEAMEWLRLELRWIRDMAELYVLRLAASDAERRRSWQRERSMCRPWHVSRLPPT